jgi:hypothetical protein
VEYPFLLWNCVRRALIAGKITVQVDVDAMRMHFGGVVRGKKSGLVSSKRTTGVHVLVPDTVPRASSRESGEAESENMRAFD